MRVRIGRPARHTDQPPRAFHTGVESLALEAYGHQFEPHDARRVVATHIAKKYGLKGLGEIEKRLGDTRAVILKTYFRTDDEDAETPTSRNPTKQPNPHPHPPQRRRASQDARRRSIARPHTDPLATTSEADKPRTATRSLPRVTASEGQLRHAGQVVGIDRRTASRFPFARSEV